MENQFVPYELALKLKELGFDEECLDFYSNENNCLFNNDPINEDSIHIGAGIPAPIWQQAFDWFRDSHGLNVVGFSANQSWSLWYFNIDKKGLTYLYYAGAQEKKFFNSPEEVRIACLKELIEIIEQQNQS